MPQLKVRRARARPNGRTFKAILARAMEEAYGIAASPASGSRPGVYAEAIEQRRRADART